jgi:hypothetical protein
MNIIIIDFGIYFAFEKKFHKSFYLNVYGIEELSLEPEETLEGFLIRHNRDLNPEIRTREVVLIQQAVAQWNRNLEEELAFINDALIVTHGHVGTPQMAVPLIATPRLLETPVRQTLPRRNFWAQAFSYFTPGSGM